MISSSLHECKLTLFIYSLRGGGSEGICVTLANSLKQNGWKVELLVLNLKDAVLRDDLSRDITITNLKVNLEIGHVSQGCQTLANTGV